MRNFFLLICLICSFQSFGQSGEKSLLYEISGKGLTHPSYIYGTFHLLCQQDLKLSPVTLEKVKNSDQVYLELDMDDPKEMMSMMNKMYMKDQGLKDLVSTSDYEYLNGFFKDSLKMNLESMQKMKPFVIMSMMYPKMLGCTPGSPELLFVQQATTAKKPVLGLETADYQFSILTKPGDKKAAEQLVEFVKDFQKSKKEFNELLALYRSQDVEALYLATQKDEQFKDQMEDLLWNRNANWVPIITKAIQEKPSFFAVGAGHLGGDKGVIALLKKQGYKVKAVK
ncbi:TraB/GumN family protein [Siphonobacter sp. SORGH_AS_0500]|uniref:TraB/GumN family protein n=1 Tax=Siphonobacter sp. SORGH_AS_0500 TaxID=1864824 RepID=UPI0028543F94|nr:TraB/GumN family protein [Siphonobacter sp. SORGH_AS_0500]MDR6196562.1 uncharacterized protein YbaP (TraB family) [Siphonobacter sp. SORGH_AS_0500]